MAGFIAGVVFLTLDMALLSVVQGMSTFGAAGHDGANAFPWLEMARNWISVFVHILVGAMIAVSCIELSKSDAADRDASSAGRPAN